MAREPGREPVDREASESLLVPLGGLVGLLLPYLVFSLQSDDAFREAKLAGQAVGGALVLAGLGLAVPPVLPGWLRRKRPPGPRPRLARAAGVLAGLFVLLLLASALANAGRVDPLTAVALLAPFPLLLVGAGPGRGAADHDALTSRLFDVLCLAGAATGALAFGQRHLGLLRMPLQVPEPRFLAAGLVGNPGDVGAALVLPGLVLWGRLTLPAGAEQGGDEVRRRAVAGAGLLAVFLGLGSAEPLTALVAFATGVVVHALFDVRRRAKPLAVLAVFGVAAVAASGLGSRLASVAGEIGAGDLGGATTQRDIGFLSAVESVRARPLLGAGPGAYGAVFVPSRLAAEERIRRPLVHASPSAHFENAHDEALTLAVECGVPALLAALAFTAVLAAGLLASRKEGLRERGESGDVALLSALLAGALVLASANFPFRIAVTSGPIALVLGLALRKAFGTRSARPTPAAAGGAGRISGLALAAGTGLALLLSAGALSRFVAAWRQGEGEALVRGLAQVREEGRPAALREAALLFEGAVSLRPRSATALLGLGSVRRLLGDEDAAARLYLRSFLLVERAETDLNLGRVLLARGDGASARLLFVRAAWILPRLSAAVPPGGVPGGVEEALGAARETLEKEGKVPPLPPLPALPPAPR